MLRLEEDKKGVIFEVRLQPKASKNEISGILEDSLKIRVTSPPVQGKANQACIEVIAKSLGLKRNEIEILSGHASRRKRLYARGITSAEFKNRLDHLIK